MSGNGTFRTVSCEGSWKMEDGHASSISDFLAVAVALAHWDEFLNVLICVCLPGTLRQVCHLMLKKHSTYG
jgi:hypothetical protein